MNYDTYSRLAITDRGTRYTHYRELLEIWEAGLEVVSNLGYKTIDDKRKECELIAGTMLLRKQLDVMCGYEEVDYGTMYSLKKVIDQLPPAGEINAGRG